MTIQINMVAIQINIATIQINMVTILNVDFSPYNGHIGKKIDAYIFGTKNREKVFAPANLLWILFHENRPEQNFDKIPQK